MVNDEMIASIVSQVKDEYGLQKFKAEISRSFNDPGYLITFGCALKLSLTNMREDKAIVEAIFAAIKPITDDIEKSSVVRSIFEKYEEQIKQLSDELSKSKITVEKLIPFKEHFDIEMRLRHGEVSEK